MYTLLCGDVDGVAGAGASDGPASLVELQELGALQLLLSSRCPLAPAVYLTLTFTPSTISHLHTLLHLARSLTSLTPFLHCILHSGLESVRDRRPAPRADGHRAASITIAADKSAPSTGTEELQLRVCV